MRAGENRLYNSHDGAVAELADAADLKSAGGDTVWVRPPPALHNGTLLSVPDVFKNHICEIAHPC